MSSKIFVTKPSIAPLDDYMEYLKSIWETGILTNDGPLVKELENKLSNYFKKFSVNTTKKDNIIFNLDKKDVDKSYEIYNELTKLSNI